MGKTYRAMTDKVARGQRLAQELWEDVSGSWHDWVSELYVDDDEYEASTVETAEVEEAPEPVTTEPCEDEEIISSEDTAPSKGGYQDIDQYAADFAALCGSAEINITYETKRGARSKRTIRAYAVRMSSEGEYLVHAWCLARSARRTFRLDRIISINAVNRYEPVKGLLWPVHWKSLLQGALPFPAEKADPTTYLGSEYWAESPPTEVIAWEV